VERVTRLSVSRLNMYFRCGMQFYYLVVKDRPVPPGWALVVGGSVHEAPHGNLKHKLAFQEFMPLDQVETAARDALAQRWDKEGVRLESEEHKKMGEKAARAEAIDTSVRLVRLHYRELAPTLRPTRVEHKWWLDVAGTDCTLTGIIDVQEALASLRELKTSKRSPTQADADDSLQLSLYALAIWKLDGALPERVWIDSLVHTKQEKLVQLQSARRPEDFGHLTNRIAAAFDAINKGVFVPAPVDAWCCSERFCGWWGMCPYARRPMSVSV